MGVVILMFFVFSWVAIANVLHLPDYRGDETPFSPQRSTPFIV